MKANVNDEFNKKYLFYCVIKKYLLYCVLTNTIFDFLREIIQTFGISPLQARVAIVEFSSSVSLSVALDNYGSKTRLMCAVDEIEYRGMA